MRNRTFQVSGNIVDVVNSRIFKGTVFVDDGKIVDLIISRQSKGLSRVFSNTTVQKHQFFSAQLSSQSNSHIHR